MNDGKFLSAVMSKKPAAKRPAGTSSASAAPGAGHSAHSRQEHRADAFLALGHAPWHSSPPGIQQVVVFFSRREGGMFGVKRRHSEERPPRRTPQRCPCKFPGLVQQSTRRFRGEQPPLAPPGLTTGAERPAPRSRGRLRKPLSERIWPQELHAGFITRTTGESCGAVKRTAGKAATRTPPKPHQHSPTAAATPSGAAPGRSNKQSAVCKSPALQPMGARSTIGGSAARPPIGSSFGHSAASFQGLSRPLTHSRPRLFLCVTCVTRPEPRAVWVRGARPRPSPRSRSPPANGRRRWGCLGGERRRAQLAPRAASRPAPSARRRVTRKRNHRR